LKNALAIRRASIYVLLVAAAVFFGLPAWFALVNSFKSLPEIKAGNVLGLPDTLTVEAWKIAWSTACTGPEACRGLSDNFRNSFIIVLPAALISTLWAGFNGYVLSKWRFRGSNLVLAILMFGTFLPWVLYLLPLSRIVDAFGMSDSVLGLIIVHIIYSLPLALFFHSQLGAFPDELIRRHALMEPASFQSFGIS
jgi:glucose/mannose transport system permease protein